MKAIQMVTIALHEFSKLKIIGKFLKYVLEVETHDTTIIFM